MPTWNPELTIGIADLDEQHRGCFAHTDALLSAMRAGRPDGELRQLMQAFADACAFHFFAEERLMRRRRYRGLEQHIVQHAIFVRMLRVYMAQIYNVGNSSALAENIRDLVYGWFVEHIATADQAIAGDRLIVRRACA